MKLEARNSKFFTRNSKLKVRDSKLETLDSKISPRRFSSFEFRVSSRVVRVSSDCQLTFDRYCTCKIFSHEVLFLVMLQVVFIVKEQFLEIFNACCFSVLVSNPR